MILHGMASRPHLQAMRLLSERHITRVILELVGNSSFTLITGYNKQRRLRHLKNGAAYGSASASPRFNIYTQGRP